MDLGELPRDADATFGGKACGLARLLDTGARVPPGFAVEATAAPPDEWSETQRETFRRHAGEMGIPAVFGISGATSIITDGQRVSVDGALGTVRPEQ